MTARRFASALWCLGLCLGSAVTCADYVGIRINTTPSAPIGVWRLMPAGARLSRGDYVELCPPDSNDFRLAKERGYVRAGACPDGYEPLFKQVSALPGDEVAVSTNGIAVNGRHLENSRARQQDHRGLSLQSWPMGQSIVPPDHVWVVSTCTPDSFDSRYFGPLTANAVRGRIIPLWVSGGQHDRS